MLRNRIITVLTFNDGVLFRTRNFQPDYRYTHKFVDLWSIDEIVLLDITRPGQGDRENFYAAVKEIAANCFVPVAAGGHVRDLDEVKRLLRIGADKVIINAEALRNPGLITQVAEAYGAQCMVVSIDAKRKPDGSYEVYTEQGRQPTGLVPEAWAKKAEEAGAGEILITSIDRDGMLEGYDNELNRRVSQAVGIPVLGCGGAGKWLDFEQGFKMGGISAACTTNIYHFTEPSIQAAKGYLHQRGILVRRE